MQAGLHYKAGVPTSKEKIKKFEYESTFTFAHLDSSDLHTMWDSHQDNFSFSQP